MARSPVDKVDMKTLKREIKRRERQSQAALRRLVARRDRWVARLHSIEREIERHGVSIHQRLYNDSNLADALAKLLAKTTMSLTALVEAVLRAGYGTTSHKFRAIVNQTLIKDKRFKRVSRGRYTAAKS